MITMPYEASNLKGLAFYHFYAIFYNALLYVDIILLNMITLFNHVSTKWSLKDTNIQGNTWILFYLNLLVSDHMKLIKLFLILTFL